MSGSSNPSSAGPSCTHFAHTTEPPLPHTIRNDADTAKEVRQYLLPKRKFLGLFPGKFHRSKSKRKERKDMRNRGTEEEEASQDTFLPTSEASNTESGLIELDDKLLSELPEDEGPDAPIYRWAVLYENQRGITLFSTQYYSAMSLLPLDPPAYTLSAPKGDHDWDSQPTVSLTSYTLPDGTWRWVSRTWMIDMREDGQVQHDGFEYAWSFRSKNWQPEVGLLSAGGWVRRRRWVRLMVHVPRGDASKSIRPDAGRTGRAVEGEEEEQGMQMPHAEISATRPPSMIGSLTEKEKIGVEVWLGDDGDWQRAGSALKELGRDGRKLELWKRWFGFGYHSEDSVKDSEKVSRNEVRSEKGKIRVEVKQYEVSSPSSPSASFQALQLNTGAYVSEAPRQCIITALRSHGLEILHSFVYPESRAQFLEILDAADLLGELKKAVGVSDSGHLLDFWSYAHDDTQEHSNGH